MAKEFIGRATIIKLDIDRLWVRDKGLVEQFKITALPLLIIYKDGREVARLVGADDTAKARVRAAISAALED